MTAKSQKLLRDFFSLCHQNNSQNPCLQSYLKSKSLKLFDQSNHEVKNQINWKDQLIEAYSTMKIHDAAKLKITVVCEQLISEFQKIIKNKDLQIEMLNNELSIIKSSLDQQRQELQKIQKDCQNTLQRQKQKLIQALQKLEDKEYEIRELQQKITQYEQQIEEIKSTQYQNMINSIKQEEILNSQAQNLYKQNTLLKYQLKDQTLIKNQLNRHIKGLNEEIDIWKNKYQNARFYINRKLQAKRQSNKGISNVSINRDVRNPQHQQTINLIQFKDDFSFKDSIQNDNNSTIVHNHIPSFLDLSSSQFFYGTQQSPDRCLMERDVLNLTDRDRSTHSRNITKHLINSKKRYIVDKQNISDNAWESSLLQQYQPDTKISKFGSKQQNTQKMISNTSIQKFIPSPRGFGTQQRTSLLSKHRRIKSSFCGKSIQQFHQYQNNHFIVNSQKYDQSMIQNSYNRKDHLIDEYNQTKNNIQDESQILGYEVNEIVINEELITSNKPKFGTGNQISAFSNMDAKMITSVKVISSPQKSQQKLQKKQPSPVKNVTPPVDVYYAFFSLTAQCVKLNAKNFNRAISVYFNLEQEYSNVLKKTIPINKWYNYIQDQLQTVLKYAN